MSEVTPPTRARHVGVTVAISLVLVSALIFAGAIVWAGGIEGALELVGLRPAPSDVSSQSQEPAAEPTEPAGETPAPVETSEPTATTEPSDEEPADEEPDDSVTTSDAGAQATFPVSTAQAAMYREQLQSQVQILKLVNGEISSVAIGTATSTSTRSSIPLTVSYKSGSSLSGTMVLSSSDGLWYFSSITAGGGSATPAKPRTVDSGVVSTIIQQQALSSSQQLMRDGLVNGGFKTARVDGVVQGSGTATVNVTLLGGTLDRKAARFVLISKIDGGNKYWFLTRFELK